MKVLVTVASRHGATKQIGELIAQELTAAGLEVTQQAPEDVQDLADYQAVVLGSAVYLTKWLPNAHDFVKRFTSQLRHLPLWAFSVGLSGVPRDQVQDPSRVGPVLLTIEPNDYITFAGRLDPSQLSLRERTVARLGGAVEGDYVDPDKVRAWAKKIAAELGDAQA